MNEDGIILVDKPAGVSSFGVVARVRRQLSEKAGRKVKVGHTGTLDPFATGLLILLSGKMTKKSGEFLKLDKVYEAVLKLGFVSATDDPEGELREVSASQPNLATLESVVASFVGEITQTPPIFSAIKINGQRAYKLARRGEVPEMPRRKVTIYEMEILEYAYPVLKIRCRVSSGTYIRSLARDIGEKLGTGAYLTELRRTKVGEYRVEDAEKIVL
ncbi:MAG: tRNA pseudouridine(55) synthase TruB [Candidatus Nomurabacteria bacterium]|jgi:tRNA pseudouridine55 synthase|nr:tRNA pseudouridine(55) synthase TruB [Candidatus Nomurabacteria bacterium]